MVLREVDDDKRWGLLTVMMAVMECCADGYDGGWWRLWTVMMVMMDSGGDGGYICVGGRWCSL